MSQLRQTAQQNTSASEELTATAAEGKEYALSRHGIYSLTTN
jgi:hypothetical protein